MIIFAGLGMKEESKETCTIVLSFPLSFCDATDWQAFVLTDLWAWATATDPAWSGATASPAVPRIFFSFFIPNRKVIEEVKRLALCRGETGRSGWGPEQGQGMCLLPGQGASWNEAHNYRLLSISH